MTLPLAKPVSEDIIAVLLQCEDLHVAESPWLNKLPVYLSAALPVALWFERRGNPFAWANLWEPSFLRTEVFGHDGKNGKLLDLVAKPMREIFDQITEEDIVAMGKRSDDAMMRFGFLAMNASRVRTDA